MKTRLALLPVLLVTALYALVALREGRPEWTYNNMADAFLSGRLSFRKELPPEILQDPYAFWRNEKYILQNGIIDQSVYRGKIYSYFGPVPAFAYMPWRAATGRRLPDRAVVFFFALGSFLWAAALARKIAERHFSGATEAAKTTLYGVIGLANASPYLISQSHMYEVAITAGAFFLNGALYFLYGAVSEDGPKTDRRLAAAGVFFGLAAGCRPHLVLAFAAAAGVAVPALVRAGKASPASLRRLFLPFAALVGALLFYNYARFDDALEFGTKYQMTPINDRQLSVLFDPSRVIANAYAFLMQSPAFAGGFPFVRQVLPAFPASLHWPGGSFYTQRTVGLLPGVPFTMLYFLAPLAAWLASGENVRSVFRREGLPARAITAGAAAYLSLIVLAELLRGLAVNGILTETALFLGRCGEEIPFAWFLAAAFAALLWKRGLAGPAGEGFPRTAFALLLAPALATFGATLFFNMHTLRYLGDFATPVLLAGGIVWLHFDRQLARDPAAAAALRVIGVALGLCSMGFGVAYAFS